MSICALRRRATDLLLLATLALAASMDAADVLTLVDASFGSPLTASESDGADSWAWDKSMDVGRASRGAKTFDFACVLELVDKHVVDASKTKSKSYARRSWELTAHARDRKQILALANKRIEITPSDN